MYISQLYAKLSTEREAGNSSGKVFIFQKLWLTGSSWSLPISYILRDYEAIDLWRSTHLAGNATQQTIMAYMLSVVFFTASVLGDPARNCLFFYRMTSTQEWTSMNSGCKFFRCLDPRRCTNKWLQQCWTEFGQKWTPSGFHIQMIYQSSWWCLFSQSKWTRKDVATVPVDWLRLNYITRSRSVRVVGIWWLSQLILQ